jgi:hypothetical protein
MRWLMTPPTRRLRKHQAEPPGFLVSKQSPARPPAFKNELRSSDLRVGVVPLVPAVVLNPTEAGEPASQSGRSEPRRVAHLRCPIPAQYWAGRVSVAEASDRRRSSPFALITRCEGVAAPRAEGRGLRLPPPGAGDRADHPPRMLLIPITSASGSVIARRLTSRR